MSVELVETGNKPRPWAEMVHTYLIERARVVATLGDDGGAIVEQVERLECREGRVLHSHGDDTYILEYMFGFGVADAPEPDAGQSVEARIVISGQHTNGLRLEIRGPGWIGYDNLGNIEGCFTEAPVMITEESCGTEDDEEEVDEESIAEFARERIGLWDDFKMPEQFEHAALRFPKPSTGEQA